MNDDEFSRTAIVIAVLVAFGVFCAIKCSNDIDERAHWESFKASHACRIVGHTKESTSFGLTSNGKIAVVGNVPKDTWLCDDGIMYTRERE